MRRTFAVALLAVALTGCISTATPSDPRVVEACADEGEISGAACGRVVATAINALGPIYWPITRAERTLICPPNAPGADCVFEGTEHGTVVLWFSFGDPVMIVVRSERQPDGSGFMLVPDDPVAVPAEVLQVIDATS